MKKLLLAAAAIAALASPAHAKPPAFVLFDCLDSYIRHLDDRRSDANTIATAIMGACSSSFALWASIFPAGEKPDEASYRRIATIRVLDSRTHCPPHRAYSCNGVSCRCT
jgi:hypothetical protein